MRLSKDFYRFSEYKCIASYMTQHFPRLLHYHTFDKYGKRGIRYRDSKEILSNIFSVCNIDSHGLSYSEFLRFINIYYHECPSYIQIEHVG